MQTNFSRSEQKYLITNHQSNRLTAGFAGHMEPDSFGSYLVQNLYYDTENWDIIRTSMEKPYYKEKMRMRRYVTPESSSGTFLELKKKFAGIVYKRRLPLNPSTDTIPDIHEELRNNESQIAKELAYHIRQTEVKEKIYISYQRKAFAGLHDEGLRLTIDTDIRSRLDNLGFAHPSEGIPLNKKIILLEIKTPTAIPLWLVRLLNNNGIVTASFSKYAACFTEYHNKLPQGQSPGEQSEPPQRSEGSGGGINSHHSGGVVGAAPLLKMKGLSQC